MVVTGIVMMAVTAFVILGGVKSIGKIVGIFVPFMMFSCPLYVSRGARCDDDELEFDLVDLGCVQRSHGHPELDWTLVPLRCGRRGDETIRTRSEKGGQPSAA